MAFFAELIDKQPPPSDDEMSTAEEDEDEVSATMDEFLSFCNVEYIILKMCLWRVSFIIVRANFFVWMESGDAVDLTLCRTCRNAESQVCIC